LFSTPFVVVLGCSQPAERPVTPGSGRGSDTVISAPDDASVEDDEAKIARIKAGFMDAQRPCVDKRGYPCNPPAPDAWVPGVREGEVIDVQSSADGVYFKAAIGVGPELSSKWKGVFVDGASPIAGTEFKIVERGGSLVTGFLAGRQDVPSRRVRFTESER